MKYLKKYNESKEELEELINRCLSYLLDDPKFKLKVTKVKGSESYLVTLTKPGDSFMDLISWVDVKDHIIPLLQVLSSDYDFIKFVKINDREYSYKGSQYDIEFTIKRGFSTSYYTMSINDVIDDDSDIPDEFYKIKIVVK